MSDFDDSFEISDEHCPMCQHFTYRRECGCDEGYSDHDCGEDCCVCFDPEPNICCDECIGHGYHHWCPGCGWDLLLKRHIAGRETA